MKEYHTSLCLQLKIHSDAADYSREIAELYFQIGNTILYSTSDDSENMAI